MEADKQKIDEALYQPFELVSAFGDIPLEFTGEADKETVRISVDTIKVSVPVELDVYTGEDGTVNLGTAPPVYDFETSFATVLHQMKLTFKVEYDQIDK